MNYTPTTISPRLVREFFRIADGILSDTTAKQDTPQPSSSRWAPKVDLYEDSKSYSVRVDIPGVPKDSVDVSYHDGLLTVSGERKRLECSGGEHRLAGEIPHGSFRREIRIDAEIKPDGIAASCSDGVLTVTVPKSESAKPVKIAVS